MPAMLAFLAKIWLIAKVKNEPWMDKLWIGFVSVLALLNLSELLLYSGLVDAQTLGLMTRNYYVWCTVGLAYSFAYVMNANKYSIQRYFSYIVFGAAGFLCVAFLFTDILVSAATMDGLVITSTKSEFYPLFSAFGGITAVLTLCVLGYNYHKETEAKQQIAYTYTVIGLIPVMFAAVALNLFLARGYSVNGSAVLPVLTTVFLLVTARGRDSSMISRDPRQMLPFGPESAAAKLIRFAQTKSALNENDFEKTMLLMSYGVLLQRLAANNGNRTKTADEMGISRSSVQRKIKEMRVLQNSYPNWPITIPDPE